MLRKRLTTNFKRNHLIYLGLFFIFIFSAWRYHQIRILSFNNAEVEKADISTGVIPMHIKSYPVGIDVNIKPSAISKGVWAIHPHDANYLISSARIGDKGNIILYGHNKNEIMGPLRYIKEGAMIEILGSDGKNYKYVVSKTDTVSPDNLSYIENTSDETLTLYTCIGILDSKRFIVVAKPMIN